jgi:hypothetical protein
MEPLRLTLEHQSFRDLSLSVEVIRGAREAHPGPPEALIGALEIHP